MAAADTTAASGLWQVYWLQTQEHIGRLHRKGQGSH